MAKVNLNSKQKEYVNEINNLSKQEVSEFVKDIGYDNFEELNNSRQKNLDLFGENKIVTKKMNYFLEFLSSFVEPFNIVLMAIGFINLLLYIIVNRALEEMVGFCLVFFMILLACITDFIQEIKAHRINISLHMLVENNYNVVNIKNDKIQLVDIKNILKSSKVIREDKLTVGDFIYFSVGDIVPADCKIIWSNNLYVNQSQLTGESDPIYKNEEFKKTSNYTDLQNILFSQSLIVEGTCIAIVAKISEESFSGIISKYAIDEETKTDFDKGISKLTKLILLMILIGFVIILIGSSFRTGSWVDGAVLAITIVVALTPEALPAIISGNLQLGSKILSKNKIVVKKFNIIQNLGSVDVFTTDKTGTLTSDKITLDSISCFSEDDKEYKYLFLNSFFQSSRTNNIDLAILNSDILKENFVDEYELIEEKQFNFSKRIVSVIVKNKKTNLYLQITKGSVNEILQISTKINDNSGQIIDLTDNKKQEIISNLEINSENGKRSILFSIKECANKIEIEESNLILKGVAFFKEEIKPNVKEAIQNIYKNDIEFKILTGDTELSAVSVAKQIDLNHIKSCNYRDKQQHDLNFVEDHNIFSRMNPEEKGEIINNLHENKHVVGYLGDGVNDVVALKLSDVGIAVNNGSSAAKQASDIILLEKDLDILNNAFVLGRKIFSNSLKFIKLTVATNTGLMLTILITSLWLTFRSMIPIQLLFQNLLFDFSNLFFVFDKVDECVTKKPMKWNIHTFIPYVIMIAIISCMISITNILIMGYGYNYFSDISNNNNLAVSKMQTIFFIESFLTHMVIILVCRTEKVAFIQSNTSLTMIAGIGTLFFIVIGLVYIPKLNDLFELSPPSLIWWGIMIGLISSTWIILETTKKLYIKLFNSWI